MPTPSVFVEQSLKLPSAERRWRFKCMWKHYHWSHSSADQTAMGIVKSKPHFWDEGILCFATLPLVNNYFELQYAAGTMIEVGLRPHHHDTPPKYSMVGRKITDINERKLLYMFIHVPNEWPTAKSQTMNRVYCRIYHIHIVIEQ